MDDQPHVTSASTPRDLRLVAVAELLARVRAARAAGEPWRADREAGALIARALPRVRNVVAAFRLPEHPEVAVRRDDREDVAQDALRRAYRMLDSFRGASEGEWYAAVHTCSRFTCRDHLRAQMTAERRLAGRLEDETFDADLARQSTTEALDAETAREAADALERAVSRLPNPNQRRTIELTRDGWTTPEIAAELGTSVDNVHQLRSRGFAQLRKDLRS